MERKGAITRSGSIVDASFVEVPRQRNSRDENDRINSGEIPEEWKQSASKLRQKDADARWAKKNNENHYGYKNHVKVDKVSKLMVSYQEVGANIDSIQQSARVNIDEVGHAVESVGKAMELANASGKALEEIVQLASSSSAVTSSIATAAEEQNATSEEINASVDEINRITAETASGMAQSSSAVQELSRMAQELRQIMQNLQ